MLQGLQFICNDAEPLLQRQTGLERKKKNIHTHTHTPQHEYPVWD